MGAGGVGLVGKNWARVDCPLLMIEISFGTGGITMGLSQNESRSCLGGGSLMTDFGIGVGVALELPEGVFRATLASLLSTSFISFDCFLTNNGVVLLDMISSSSRSISLVISVIFFT